MNTIGYFEIHSSDPKREIEFYQHLFGWNFVREKSVPIEYYRVETNGGINGGRVALPKFAVPGKCWQGYYLDKDGNTFGIFQFDESAK